MLGHSADVFVGDDACRHAGLLTQRRPVRRGAIASAADVELILHHSIFRLARAVPEDHPLILPVPASFSRKDVEVMADLAFSAFNAPAALLPSAQALAVLGVGRGTALCVDIGAETTHIVPVWEGVACLPHSRRSVQMGAADVASGIFDALRARGVELSAVDSDLQAVERMLRAHAYVAADAAADAAAAAANPRVAGRAFTLPDGASLEVGSERFLAPEALITAVCGGNTQGGLIAESVASLPPMMHDPIAATLVLAGGGSLLPGLPARVGGSLAQALASAGDKGAAGKVAAGDVVAATAVVGAVTSAVHVCAAEWRHHATFIGASVLATLPSFPRVWTSKAEYDEQGPAAVFCRS